MDAEEAALRAKIQAVRNLLAAKQRQRFARKPWAPAPVASANRVWVNQNAVRPAPSPTPPLRGSFASRAQPQPQVQPQVLRLEDGEYAKANGGFSLVRSDVIKAKTPEVTKPAQMYRKPVLSSSTAARAQAAVHRARLTTRGKAKARVRTEYCRFFNQFGYCNNKNACKFLHDSRRVALCRKFVRGICTDSQCLLSHDKNKMPVCMMFLRGVCTRDDCRFRHVKVSGSAQVCEAFLSGHCPQGDTCPMKHEAPVTVSKKRSLSIITNTAGASPTKQHKADTSPLATGTSSSAESNVEAQPPSLSSSPTSVVTATPLSIRPNIRFAPRHNDGVFPLLLPLRKRQLQPPTNE